MEIMGISFIPLFLKDFKILSGNAKMIQTKDNVLRVCLSVFIWDSVIDSKQVKESASEMNFLSEGWEIRTARVYNLLHFRTPVKT